MAENGDKPTCFIAMPITTHPDQVERYGGDKDHWLHVMETLFVPAIEAAGIRPIQPVAEGSHLIHGLIIRNLSEADLVLVDLSTHNPNVFFELGVRTSLNLPIALVRDEHTSLPFDTSGINTHTYGSSLRGWELEAQREALAKHIADSSASCDGQNPLWRQFGLVMRASEPEPTESPLEAKVDLMASQLVRLEERIEGHSGPEQVKYSLDEHGRVIRVSMPLAFSDGTDSAAQFAEAIRTACPAGLDSIRLTSRNGVAIAFEEDPGRRQLNRLSELARQHGIAATIEYPSRTS